MLRLRISCSDSQKPRVIQGLRDIEGVDRVTADRDELDADWVIDADLTPSAADRVLTRLIELKVPDSDYVMVRQEVIAPKREPGTTIESDQGFAWAEVLGQARENSRPIGRYVVLMAVAGCIAAMGVLTDNSILIVGAMAVSPDLLPICATCVALVGRRSGLAGRAFATLLIGMAIVMGVAAMLALFLRLVGILEGDLNEYLGGLGGLVKADYSTVIIALAAGIAAILSFETRAAAAVGVAISVTTVPASAYYGVAIGLGDASTSTFALVTLAMYVTLMILAGTVTLAIQRWLIARANG
ncbi:MAG TPA: DUF389 domain-containing protein [Solirubrobacterales bacterium]|nr:DUF389 domain-containing protein [Solirubrobacterales bacterium]